MNDVDKRPVYDGPLEDLRFRAVDKDGNDVVFDGESEEFGHGLRHDGSWVRVRPRIRKTEVPADAVHGAVPDENASREVG